MVDINRSTSGVYLPEAVSGEILAKVQEASVIQRVARRLALPGNGTAVSIITGEPTASWVGETEEKPVSNPTVSNKVLRPYKLAVIETFSNEFRRDLPALYSALADRLPAALAKKFDTTAFHGTAPGSDFDTLAGAADSYLTYNGLVDVISGLGADGYDFNGVVVAPQGEAELLRIKDNDGRPIFIGDAATASGIGSVLGRPVFKNRSAYLNTTNDVLGFAGDWSQAIWGQVGDVQIKISDQATLVSGESTINLFQQNMFAVLAEIEVGFRVSNTAAFRKLIAD
ncbi:major_cap_HK97, phage major capsid protein, HK97 family [uncultured Caudovirales phage]|uniref:Major_cap_HK97, phage major capsid protein, HK97 family n=1 Tax=uncultured Caudovirales phage TaxID=2100421 RepID=A0A6J5N5K0_9CAUD|nr:major_cap_HK97, phage major capsid protein, HK97 family [uncultured Caudovirales phage]